METAIVHVPGASSLDCSITGPHHLASISGPPLSFEDVGVLVLSRKSCGLPSSGELLLGSDWSSFLRQRPLLNKSELRTRLLAIVSLATPVVGNLQVKGNSFSKLQAGHPDDACYYTADAGNSITTRLILWSSQLLNIQRNTKPEVEFRHRNANYTMVY